MYTDIKSFEDACTALQLDPEKILPNFSCFPEQHREALTAHSKLVIIAEAVNEGWKPDWNDSDQRKWYPWFDMEEGFVFDVYDCIYQLSAVGSRLCFEKSEVARYMGEQFQDLYKAYFTL